MTNMLDHEISRLSPTDSKVLLYETRLRLNCLYKPLNLISSHWWGEHPSGCEPPAGPPRWAQHARSDHFFQNLSNFNFLREVIFHTKHFKIPCLGLHTACDARILTSEGLQLTILVCRRNPLDDFRYFCTFSRNTTTLHNLGPNKSQPH